MYQNREIRTDERRRKRMFIPIMYFMAEATVVWLVLTLIQLNFNILEWSIWSILFFIMAVGYSALKTVHVYERQKDYPKNKKEV